MFKDSIAIKNIVAGTLLTVFGVGFGIYSTVYKIGTLTLIGPGFFPLIVSLFLTGCGTTLVIRGLVNDR